MKLEDPDKLLFIKCMKARPLIWDPRNGNHNRSNITQAYNEIAEELAAKTGRQYTGFFYLIIYLIDSKIQWSLCEMVGAVCAFTSVK